MDKLVPLPPIVSEVAWQAAHEALLAKEKSLTRARDALAAERRRQPMVEIAKRYVFDGPDGPVSLLDLFEGRQQLILYHFMFGPGAHGWPDAGCPGCSMFVDQLCHPAHLHARDTSLALISIAPLAKIEAYRKRMGWTVPWVSSAGNDFNKDFGMTAERGEMHGLSVFLRDSDRIFRTYFTSARGLETVGSVWSLLDLTPLGRQEEWEIRLKAGPKRPPINGGAAMTSTTERTAASEPFVRARRPTTNEGGRHERQRRPRLSRGARHDDGAQRLGGACRQPAQ